MFIDYILICLLVICLYTDIKYKKIYNLVLLPAAVIALTGNLYLNGLEGVLFSMKGFLLGLGVLIIPFIFGGMGAGDVKLMAVIGAFKGPEFVWLAFLATAIAGGILSLIVMIKSGQFKLRLRAIWYTLLSIFYIVPRADVIGSIHNSVKYQTFPYGIAIVTGTAVAYILR
ncbi:MAG: prepilin peptidase [Firmicutes bacterium]|nr:prepilin peptidase [Bacillota bacterium]